MNGFSIQFQFEKVSSNDVIFGILVSDAQKIMQCDS